VPQGPQARTPPDRHGRGHFCNGAHLNPPPGQQSGRGWQVRYRLPHQKEPVMNAPAELKDYVIADLSLADWGRKEIRHRGNRNARPDGHPRGIRDAASRCAARASPAAAHDHPDRGADRDAAGARRRSALGLVQHLLDAGPRRRRDRRAGTPVFAVKGESLEEYWDYTHRIFESARTAAKAANMILDDGGDATLLLHLGTKAENRPDRADHQPGERRRGVPVQRDQGHAGARPELVHSQAHQASSRA
jgi:hypothetical protein